jgi:hypothetical protein
MLYGDGFCYKAAFAMCFCPSTRLTIHVEKWGEGGWTTTGSLDQQMRRRVKMKMEENRGKQEEKKNGMEEEGEEADQIPFPIIDGQKQSM